MDRVTKDGIQKYICVIQNVDIRSLDVRLQVATGLSVNNVSDKCMLSMSHVTRVIHGRPCGDGWVLDVIARSWCTTSSIGSWGTTVRDATVAVKGINQLSSDATTAYTVNDEVTWWVDNSTKCSHLWKIMRNKLSLRNIVYQDYDCWIISPYPTRYDCWIPWGQGYNIPVNMI